MITKEMVYLAWKDATDAIFALGDAAPEFASDLATTTFKNEKMAESLTRQLLKGATQRVDYQIVTDGAFSYESYPTLERAKAFAMIRDAEMSLGTGERVSHVEKRTQTTIIQKEKIEVPLYGG